MPSDKLNILPRGFKAKAERLSLEYRNKLDLQLSDAIIASELAKHMKVAIYTPKDFGLTQADIENIVGTKTRESGWSALTMITKSGNRIIIHNDSHSPARQQSDIMHELAHIICEHKQSACYEELALPMSMREYNVQQEEEANVLGSALIIPRDGLLDLLRKNWTHDNIAKNYNASSEMLKFRINTTAVMKQLKYRR